MLTSSTSGREKLGPNSRRKLLFQIRKI